jgi:hypothetical protein
MLIKKLKYLQKDYVNLTYVKFDLCEPNLCEPVSRDFPVNFDFKFTFSQSSNNSCEPVNLDSHITHAPS